MTASAPSLDPHELIRSLQSRLDDVLGSRIPPNTTVALLDYPNHDNVGDTLIWQGTIRFLHKHRCEIGYACDRTSFSPRRLTKRIGPGAAVLLHGGGNFGDVWPTFQRFREHAVDELPHHPIVQLPQSVEFRDPSAMQRSAAVMNRHPQLTIVTRDTVSQRALQASLTAEVLLAPDMAFALGTLARDAGEAVSSVLWLARTDAERLHEPQLGGDVLIVDWPRESARMKTFRYGNRILGKGLALSNLDLPRATNLHHRMLSFHAEQRQRAGLATMANPRVVITDRLHAHILCVLLGLPHILLDNSYGKLRRFYEAWTSNLHDVQWATSPNDALDKALALSAELAGRPT